MNHRSLYVLQLITWNGMEWNGISNWSVRMFIWKAVQLSARMFMKGHPICQHERSWKVCPVYHSPSFISFIEDNDLGTSNITIYRWPINFSFSLWLDEMIYRPEPFRSGEIYGLSRVVNGVGVNSRLSWAGRSFIRVRLGFVCSFCWWLQHCQIEHLVLNESSAGSSSEPIGHDEERRPDR